MATREEAVRFSLIDNVTKGLIKIQDSVTGVGASLVKLNAAAQLAATGIQAVSNVGASFNNLIKGASDAQFQLAGLQAALGATPEELAKLDAEAKRVSETLGLFTKTDVLNALGDLGRAGLSATQAMEALTPVLNLATGGQVDLAFATEVTVNTLTQFGLSIDQAGKLANGLVTAANSSTTNVNDLGLALSYAATQARAAGNDLETTLEVLAALAQTGLQGERAGTALRTVFAELSESGSKFATALRTNYGITTQNLVEVIEKLRGTADGGKQALLALGIEARPAIQGLIQLAVPEFNKLRESVTLTGTAAEDATRLLTETYQAAAGRLENILTNLRNQLAVPILQPLGDAFESLAKRVNEFSKTEDFKLLTQAITDFAKDAGLALEQLIAEFDFKEASENARQFFENLQSSLDAFKETAQASIETLKVIFETLNVTVAAVQVAFNGTAVAAAKFAEVATAGAIAIAKFRGESEETIAKLKLLRDVFQDIGEERFENLGAATDRLVRSFGNLVGAAGEAEAGTRKLSGATANAGESAETLAQKYDRLAKVIAGARTKDDVESATLAFKSFVQEADGVSDELLRLGKGLENATVLFGDVESESEKASEGIQKTGEAFTEAGDASLELKDSAKVVAEVGTAAKNAADDTARLAQAFRDANSAGQFEGALDQFERLKASGRLTAEQIAEIEKAAKEAGKRFEDIGKEGEDAFDRVTDAAEGATDAVEGIASAAKSSASNLQEVFNRLAQSQEDSFKRNEEIQQQIEDQREQANSLLEKEIELIERKLNLSREELAIAERLRNQYKMADQDRIDRYAQLIARQRELNREREEELRIISTSGGAAAPGGGSSGVNGRPVGTGRPAASGAGDSSGDGAQSAPLTVRTLARLLEPELARLRLRGG